MSDLRDPKPALQHYLQQAREALVWKLDGLGEQEVRLPRTPTGTHLLGIVRHCANVEIGYFGPTFGRAWPDEDAPAYVTDAEGEADPQADWRVPADISTTELVDFYRSVWAFADETIAALPLDAEGRVPWWPEERATVSLQRIIVHVVAELSRHAGQADVIREGLDGAAGLREDVSNLPDGTDWPAYVAELTRVAESFPPA
ncbi:DinB family protein [Nocardioides zeicaulis]|uniref:DinB family protein n=1 Tax=Nocardioides zeicaulis TaxID=1776857 RepID=A0ABV6E174_9ACTN